jgi:hypothetical protein
MKGATMKVKIGKHHALFFLAMLLVAYDYPVSMPDVCYSTTHGKVRLLSWNDTKVQSCVRLWAYYLQKDMSEIQEKWHGVLAKLHEVPILVAQGRIKVVNRSKVTKIR